MPTIKQKKAVNKIIENRGNISKSMREVGYRESTCKNPKNLTESKGFKKLCEGVGLTEELILKSLSDDIKSKPSNRVSELALAAKIQGMLSNKIDTNQNLTITFDPAFNKNETKKDNSK